MLFIITRAFYFKPIGLWPDAMLIYNFMLDVMFLIILTAEQE